MIDAFQLIICEQPEPELWAIIASPLHELNSKFIRSYESSVICIKILDNEGLLRGGLWGTIDCQWLYVDVLAVPKKMQRRGIGSQLLRTAENEAREKGCHGAWLGTFNFQAKEFYMKCGYSEFACLNNYPEFHTLHFLKKEL